MWYYILKARTGLGAYIMRILISNDDGIAAEGIKALMSNLAKEHDVYVVAPDRERSAAGHSLTLHSPIRVEELEPQYGVKKAWVTNGTPGDCVKIAICALLKQEELPNIVISGINHGPNLGTDILYLLPIHPIGVKNKKGSLGCPYSIQDYRKICRDLGTFSDFEELITKYSGKNLILL